MPETTPGPPISLAQTWADQADLEGLFQSRRPAHRDRVYPPNDNYGFGPCLRRFAGIAPEESIHAIVPHGHNYPLIDGRRQAPEQERIDAIPTVLASSDACLEAFRNAGGKRVIRHQSFAWKVQTYQEMHALRSHFQVERKRSEPSRDQRALSELFLGSSHQRSPSELKQILNSLRPQAPSLTL